MFVFQLHLCEEKAGKHDVVYFREYWIFCHLRQRSRISSERQNTGLRKSVSPPCRFIYEQKDDNLLKMFWRCSLKRWMSQGCVPLSPCVKNRFYAETPSLQLPPPDSTQITTFKSEAAKVLSAPPPWSDQKLATDKINFHFSSYGRVWSSGSWGDYPRKRVIGCLLNITDTLLIGLEGSPRVQKYSEKNKFVKFHWCALCCKRAWAPCAFNLCREKNSWENLILGIRAFPFIQFHCLTANVVLGFQ